MLATMTYNGQIQRLWWPRMDIFQQIEEWNFAITLEGHSNILWLHDEYEWNYTQSYLDDAPIVLTQGRHKVLPVSWEFIDFILPDRDCLIRKIKVKNESSEAIDVKLWQYSNLYIDERARYNTVEYSKKADAILHYRGNTVIGIFSSRSVSEFQCGGNVKANIKKLSLDGHMQEMESEGALMWDLGHIDADGYIYSDIYLLAETSIDKIYRAMANIRDTDTDELQYGTYTYWQDIYKRSVKPNIKDEKLKTLYLRSIMVFHLLSHAELGGILAAPEVDEDFQHCGGYGFCWGRDAAYITSAIDAVGYPELVEEFYRWTVMAQNADGSWSQRHYLDGTIAPNWGLQIDETGSILWGVWKHYKVTGSREFLSNMWLSIEKGAQFLISYIDKTTGLPLECYDLWEERVGQHTYSAAAVYGGLTGAAKSAKELGFDDLAKLWEDSASSIKENIIKRCWDSDRNRFLRGVIPNRKGENIQTDSVVDISLIGLVYPFEVIDPRDKRVISTANAIYDRLLSPGVGGIKRYEDDLYMGGNPWILTTFWLAYYYVLIDELERAKQLFEWAIDHATSMGLFPEQIHRNTGKPAWVVPLTWSHAMYILVLEILLEREVIS